MNEETRDIQERERQNPLQLDILDDLDDEIIGQEDDQDAHEARAVDQPLIDEEILATAFLRRAGITELVGQQDEMAQRQNDRLFIEAAENGEVRDIRRLIVGLRRREALRQYLNDRIIRHRQTVGDPEDDDPWMKQLDL